MPKALYHPNALPIHLRERLPDPNRLIDTPVIPATAPLFDDLFEPMYQALAQTLGKSPEKQTDVLPKNATLAMFFDVLKQQQTQTPKPSLTLTEFFKHARLFGLEIIETVVARHGDFYPNQAESRLMMTATLWQNLVAIYLISQCATRKTLNHDLTLHTLSEQMNGYIANHRQEIEFLTYHHQLSIDPDNVAFAILALDGKLSKKGDIGERVTNLVANNFLSNFQ